MAENSETLNIIVRMKDLAGRGLKGLSAGLDKTRSKIAAVNDAVFSLKGTLITLTSGVSFGLLAREFVQTASAFEGWRTRLNRVLGSVEEGNRLFDEMKTLAKESTAEYSSIMEAATSMAGVMEGGVEETTKYMKIADDLAAVTGLGIQETTSQLIRMYSAGAASADLFRERGVLAMLGFQAGVSYSADETRKRLIAMYEDPASKVRGASKDLANTYQGLLSMIADEWQDFQASVMDSGVFDYLKAVVATVLDTIRELRASGQFQDFERNVGQYIINSLKQVIQTAAIVGDAFRGWQMIWEGLKLAWYSFAYIINNSLSGIYSFILKIAEGFEKLSGLLSSAGMTTLGEDFQEVANDINNLIGQQKQAADIGVEHFGKLLDESNEHLGQLAAQESYWTRTNKLLKKITERAKEFKKATEEGPANLAGRQGKQAETASMEARLKAQLTVFKAQSSLALTTLDILYKEGSRSLEEYFGEREALITERYDREIALAQEAARKATTADKREVAEANVAALEIKQQEELTKLQQQQADAKKKLRMDEMSTEQMLADMRTRIMEEGMDKERAMYEKQMLELEQRQAQEIEALREQKATIEQINDAHRLHELEQEKLLNDQKEALRQKQWENASTVASGISDVFGQLYQDSGETVKEFFYLQKAAAVAEALINAHVAASNALKEGGTYMGPVLAAIHYAKAMMYVSQIRSQKLAAGGEVLGHSPSPTADNIPIDATAGEFMQPVSSVKYYGKPVMEAIRRKMIPKELFTGIALPRPKAQYGHALAAGGAVTSGEGEQQQQAGAEGITIVNSPDPSLLERYLASTSGKRTLLNIMRSDSYEFKAALSEE